MRYDIFLISYQIYSVMACKNCYFCSYRISSVYLVGPIFLCEGTAVRERQVPLCRSLR